MCPRVSAPPGFDDVTSNGAPRAPKGARLLVVAQIAKMGVLLLGLVVLSRLLTPAQFGIVAVPLAVIGVGELLRDLGLSAATISAKTLPHMVRDSLFWINVTLGLGLALLASAVSLIIAVVSADPTTFGVLAPLSLVFVINGIGAQYRANLTRDMRFSALAVVDSAAGLLGVGSAILLALLGAGHWALVGQPIVVASVTALLSVTYGGWRPGKPRKSVETGQIVRFGASVAFSQALQYTGNNADTFMLGFWVSKPELGNYTRGFQLAIQPLGMLKAPLTSVALPMLSRQTDDADRFERNALRGQRLLAYTIVPLAVFLAAAADPVVRIVLGTQWDAAIPVVALLALAGALQQLVSVSNWIFIALNRGKDLRRYSMVSTLIKVVLIAAAAPFGIVPVALAYLTASVVSAPLVFVWACRVAKIKVARAVSDLLPALLVLVVAGVAAYGTTSAIVLSSVLELLLCVVTFAAVYGASLVIPSTRRDIRMVVHLVLNRG